MAFRIALISRWAAAACINALNAGAVPHGCAVRHGPGGQQTNGGKPMVSPRCPPSLGSLRSRWCSELAQLFQQILALGDGAGLVHLGPFDDALAVHEKCRALVHAALFVEHAV